MKRYNDIIHSYSDKLNRYSKLISEQDFKDYVGVSIFDYEKRLQNLSLGLKDWKFADAEIDRTIEPNICLNTVWHRNSDPYTASAVYFTQQNEVLTAPSGVYLQVKEPHRFADVLYTQANEVKIYPNSHWTVKAEAYQGVIDHFTVNGIIDSDYDSFQGVQDEISKIKTYFAAQGLEADDFLDIHDLSNALYWRKQYGAEWKEVYVALNTLRAGYAVLDDIEEIVFHGRDKVFCTSPTRIFLFEYFDLLFTVKWVSSESDSLEINPFLNVNNRSNEQKKYKCAA